MARTPEPSPVTLADLRVDIANVATSMKWMKIIGTGVSGLGGAILAIGAYALWDLNSTVGEVKQTVGQLQGAIGPKPEDPNQTVVKVLNEILKAVPKPPEPQPKKLDEKGNPIPQ